jgi:glycosyltransferase involved in cell wall biosynthesis
MIQDNTEFSNCSSLLVSVIIPAYNARFLREAVESIFSQTFSNFEVIVVDDGSPGSAIKDICDAFPEVLYIRQLNAGPSVARNLGIQKANGELIAFLDDDDTWLPDKLQKQIDFFISLPDRNELGLVYTGQYMFDGDITHGAKVDSANGMVYPYLLFGQFIGTCSSVLIPKKVFQEVGDFDSSLVCTQDFELFLRIARQKPIYSIDEPLIRYRTRPDQISKDPTLNNKEDKEVLAKQRKFVTPELYRRVTVFNRLLRGARYKEKAYDCLFRKGERFEYCRWICRSVIEGRRLPSIPSFVYLLLCLVPGRLAQQVANLKSRQVVPAQTDLVYHQNVMSDAFTWMGVPRGALSIEACDKPLNPREVSVS